MAKSYKMAKCVFYGQRGLKMAKFFEIGRDMANLATLVSVSPGTQQTTSSMYTEGALSCHTSIRLILTNLSRLISRLRGGMGLHYGREITQTDSESWHRRLKRCF